MCILSCTKENSRETTAWDNGLRICQDHLNAIRQHVVDSSHSTLKPDGFNRGNGNVPIADGRSELVDDFVKVIVLLHFHTEVCMSKVRESYNEYSRHKGREQWSVSKALEYYEGLSWFPPNRVLLTGYLSANDFMASIRLGMNTDPGAGVAHGALSHRFQWHAIMRVMTNEFTEAYTTCWNHSPLQLFQSYFEGWGAEENVWGRSLDLQAHVGWGNPDNVLSDLRQSDMRAFSQSLSRRADRLDRRKRAVLDAIMDAVDANEVTRAAAMNHDAIGQQVHIWKKTGGPPQEVQDRLTNLLRWGPVERPELAACRVWQRLSSDPATATFAVSSHGARYRSAAGATGVLVRATTTTTDIDAATVNSSRHGLDTARYSMSVMGSQPRNES